MKPQDTFRFYEDDGIYRTVHISDYENGLPDHEFTDHYYGWLAAHWGLPVGLSGWDLKLAVWHESGRRKPCRTCRGSHRLSVDPYLCDSCFLRQDVAQRRAAERNRRAARERAAARRLVASMPAGRRRLLAGQDFASRAEAFREAYDEVPS